MHREGTEHPERALRLLTFPMETSYTWAAAGEGQTRMTLRNHGSPSGFSKLVAPLMASAMPRANRKDLAALEALLEGIAPPSPRPRRLHLVEDPTHLVPHQRSSRAREELA